MLAQQTQWYRVRYAKCRIVHTHTSTGGKLSTGFGDQTEQITLNAFMI